MYNAPLFPTLAVPELNTNRPLRPPVPVFAVRILSSPLLAWAIAWLLAHQGPTIGPPTLLPSHWTCIGSHQTLRQPVSCHHSMRRYSSRPSPQRSRSQGPMIDLPMSLPSQRMCILPQPLQQPVYCHHSMRRYSSSRNPEITLPGTNDWSTQVATMKLDLKEPNTWQDALGNSPNKP